MNIQRIVRFRSFYARHLANTKLSDYTAGNEHFIYNFINKFNESPRKCSYQPAKSCINLYSTSVVSDSEELVDANVFEKVCEETLESLTEFLEELIESKEALKTADVSYSDGVLTVSLGNKLGTYVINRQSPNRQIWLSSPISGPKRYDFVVNGNYWNYKHDMVPLHKLLQSELSTILGEKIDFSKCLYSKV